MNKKIIHADKFVVGYLWFVKHICFRSLDSGGSGLAGVIIWFALPAHLPQETQILVLLPGALVDSFHLLVWCDADFRPGALCIYGRQRPDRRPFHSIWTAGWPRKLRRNGRLPFIATFIFPLRHDSIGVPAQQHQSHRQLWRSGIFPIRHTGVDPGNGRYRYVGSHFPRLLVRRPSSTGPGTTVLSGRAFAPGSLTFAIVLAVTIGYGIIRLAAAPDIGSLDTVPVASFTMTENHMGELNELSGRGRHRCLPARNAGRSWTISGDDGNGHRRRRKNHPLAGTGDHRR